MSVVRLQFEYQLSLPYTPPLGLLSFSDSLLRNRASGVEKGAAHKLKPSPFTSSIRVQSSVRIPILPSTSQPLCLAYTHLIPQAYLGPLSDPNREPILDTYPWCKQVGGQFEWLLFICFYLAYAQHWSVHLPIYPSSIKNFVHIHSSHSHHRANKNNLWLKHCIDPQQIWGYPNNAMQEQRNIDHLCNIMASVGHTSIKHHEPTPMVPACNVLEWFEGWSHRQPCYLVELVTCIRTNEPLARVQDCQTIHTVQSKGLT
jgi:hypothetical protein